MSANSLNARQKELMQDIIACEGIECPTELIDDDIRQLETLGYIKIGPRRGPGFCRLYPVAEPVYKE